MNLVFALEDGASFAVLNTSWHTNWIADYCSTLETRLRYILTDGFETFPFPAMTGANRGLVETVGERYHELRRQIMKARNEGLTKTYNRLHDRGENSEDIGRLRALQVEMDQTVAAAYGWSDLDLGHGFHETKQGVRYTISESIRRTVLDNLLELNHQRYADEVKAGLHEKGAKKGKGKKASSSPAEPNLF